MRRSIVCLVALISLLTGCGPSDPVRIGFIGGLTGRNADLGLTGRNGALLAVEQCNQAGGLLGHKVELSIQDDAQSPEIAIQAVETLATSQVAAIIGPMTSAIADAILPITERAGLVMVSPTVTATQFSGQDDLFFRVVSTTRDYARAAARFHYQRQGLRRVAIGYDLRNQAFSESTLNEFRMAFTELGGTIAIALPFESATDTQFGNLVHELLQAQPDALMAIAGAVDTARLAQQARKQAPELPLIATQWAASEQLIELGGRSVEGLHLAQLFNRNDPSPRYQAFRQDYRARFKQEPGFASIAAYDAARIVLEALNRPSEHRSLKEILLHNTFAGVQQPIRFDRFGDTERPVSITMIRDGQFIIVE